MNKIRIKIRIAVMNAVPFSPKNFNEVKKSIGCIIARRSKKGVLPVLSPIGRYTWFLNINDWAALPLLMRKSITLPMWYNVIMGTLQIAGGWMELESLFRIRRNKCPSNDHNPNQPNHYFLKFCVRYARPLTHAGIWYDIGDNCVDCKGCPLKQRMLQG